MAKNKRLAEQMKKAEQRCFIYNAVCAGVLAVSILFFFVNFFVYSDGTGKVNGFKMAFLLFGDNISDSGLFAVNNRHPGSVAVPFASVMALLSLIATIALSVTFAVRAFLRKPLLSKWLLPVLGAAFIVFILQAISCSVLISTVKNHFSDINSCCVPGTQGFFGLIMYIGLLVAYAVMSLNLKDMGVTFKKSY